MDISEDVSRPMIGTQGFGGVPPPVWQPKFATTIHLENKGITKQFTRSTMSLTSEDCPAGVLFGRIRRQNIDIFMKKIIWCIERKCPIMFESYGEMQYVNEDTIQFTKNITSGALRWDSIINVYTLDNDKTQYWFVLKPA